MGKSKITSQAAVLGVDVGGSGIKAAIVDTENGELLTKRRRIATPEGFQAKDIEAVIGNLAREFDYNGPIGVGFPTVVINGVIMAPPTALDYPGWVGYSLANGLAQKTGCTVTVINDADAASLAEMDFGAGRGRDGVVIVFTLGTGIGSGLFHDGQLVPNLELGRLYLPGSDELVEHQASSRVREEEGLGWKEWGNVLNTYFQYVEDLFSPELMIIGGGISKKHKRFLPYIKTRAEILPAAFRNEAGIVGAAMAAVEPHLAHTTGGI